MLFIVSLVGFQFEIYFQIENAFFIMKLIILIPLFPNCLFLE